MGTAKAGEKGITTTFEEKVHCGWPLRDMPLEKGTSEKREREYRQNR